MITDLIVLSNQRPQTSLYPIIPFDKVQSLFLQTTFSPNCAFEASSIKEPGHLSMSRFGKRVKVIPPRHSDEGTIEKRMSFYSELESEYPSVTLYMHPIKPVTLSLQRVKGCEKSQRGEMQRVKRGERYAESKGREGGGGGG
jgi:hypothetical protein